MTIDLKSLGIRYKVDIVNEGITKKITVIHHSVVLAHGVGKYVEHEWETYEEYLKAYISFFSGFVSDISKVHFYKSNNESVDIELAIAQAIAEDAEIIIIEPVDLA